MATRRSRRHPAHALRALARHHLTGLVAGMMLVGIVLAAVLAPWIAPGDPTDMQPVHRLKSPAEYGVMGTDVFGRDILSRILFGARISLLVGAASVLAAAVVGTVLGLVSGYLRGWQDYTIMRVMDVLFSFPSILLAILIVSINGAGFGSIMLAIVLVQTPIFARVVRGAVLVASRVDYVQAAEAAGASTSRILFRHILPNVMAPMLVQIALSISGAVVMEAALSYLGLGAVPPTPSLGSMLSENRVAMEQAPWAIVFPGLALGMLVLAINLFGDTVRDLLDPRVRSATSV
jgi:peptide/nickel transport system permease protein